VLIVVGLGANLGDARAGLAAAARQLAARYPLAAASSLWRTAPVGPPQPDYLNAAVLLRIDDHPLALLALCQRLERAAGRDRAGEPRWGPRTLDLDLLVAQGCVSEGPRLRLPHPRLHERRFALLPAAEVAPDWLHPRCHRPLADLACDPGLAGQACRREGPLLAAGD